LAPYFFILALAFLDVLFPIGIYFWGLPLLATSTIFIGNGTLDISEIFLLCLIGTYSGSMLNFILSNAALSKFPNLRKKLDDRLIGRIRVGLTSNFGLLISLVLMRFTAVTRPLSGVACSFVKVSSNRFVRMEFVASLLWVTVWCLVAYFFPHLIDVSGIQDWISSWLNTTKM
jgi:membrane protein DedA with SNARE-associated domain